MLKVSSICAKFISFHHQRIVFRSFPSLFSQVFSSIFRPYLLSSHLVQVFVLNGAQLKRRKKILIIVSTRVCWRTFPFNNGYSAYTRLSFTSISSPIPFSVLVCFSSCLKLFHRVKHFSNVLSTYTKLFLPCRAYLFPIFIVYFPNSSTAGMKNPFCTAESHCYYFYLSY